MDARRNHGGGPFAKKKGINRKADARYDLLSNDYNRMVQQKTIGDGHREADGYAKPGSRKKIH